MTGSPIFLQMSGKCPVYARKMPTFYPVLCGRIVAWKFWLASQDMYLLSSESCQWRLFFVLHDTEMYSIMYIKGGDWR